MKSKQTLEKEQAILKKKLESIDTKLKEIAEKERKKLVSYEELDTFEKCCKVTGDNPKNRKFKEGDEDTIAYEMLKVIVKAINGKQTAKTLYYPYFDKTKKPGSGFVYSNCSDWSYCSFTSSRLGFIDSPRALFAGRVFEEIYYKYIV